MNMTASAKLLKKLCDADRHAIQERSRGLTARHVFTVGELMDLAKEAGDLL